MTRAGNCPSCGRCFRVFTLLIESADKAALIKGARGLSMLYFFYFLFKKKKIICDARDVPQLTV